MEYSGKPPHHGCVVGTVLDYGVPGAWMSGIFLGAVRQGVKCPTRIGRDPHTNRAHYIPPAPGVMLTDGNSISSVKTFVPVSDLRFMTDRERKAPDRYEPDEREQASRGLHDRLRLAVFTQRSVDGRCACFCCGRRLVMSKDEAVRCNVTAKECSDYCTVMEAGHVLAHSRGGPDIFVNLWPSCTDCNGRMGRELFHEFALAKVGPISVPAPVTTSSLFRQALQQWTEWFDEWDEDRPALRACTDDWSQHEEVVE